MTKSAGRSMSLVARLTWLEVVVIGATILLSLGLSVHKSVGLLESGLERNLATVAKLLAAKGLVVEAYRTGRASPELVAYLDAVLADETNSIDVVTLADQNSVRLYHPNKSLVGEKFLGGDEGPAVAGQAYASKAVGTLGPQLRWFQPVLDADGRQLGFVHVSMLTSNLDALRRQVVASHLQALILTLAFGVSAAVLSALSIKRALLGFEPDQIAAIFLRRGEVMDSLEEGLLAVNERGAIVLLNAAAEGMLDVVAQDVVGRDVDEAFPQLRLKEARDERPARERALSLNEQSLFFERLPIKSADGVIGALAILRDRTELVRLAEQLTGVNHVLEALRANTHEFMNQLHVILGLLQAGEVARAERYIMSVGQVQSATLSTAAKTIGNRVLAALMLAKISRCHELGVRLNVLADSVVPRRSHFLSTRNLVTIVGNLTENAIEAIGAKPSPGDAEISLLVREDEQSLMVVVDDTGVGLTAEEIARLGEPGWTTKGEGRGTGLGLVKAVMAEAGGELSVESEKGVGTSMTLVFRRPRVLRGGW
ncbi:MAG: sensor histidine kinase [Deltaproteobacteria bacterium]|jgi:sensor histidine kinase regulating citrate/malate metabolism|nr:sensor histidine kinase [Deltaproteobacteria bacterium]